MLLLTTMLSGYHLMVCCIGEPIVVDINAVDIVIVGARGINGVADRSYNPIFFSFIIIFCVPAWTKILRFCARLELNVLE